MEDTVQPMDEVRAISGKEIKLTSLSSCAG
jgi:hypothetical protein